jgi:hypothetical protein
MPASYPVHLSSNSCSISPKRVEWWWSKKGYSWEWIHICSPIWLIKLPHLIIIWTKPTKSATPIKLQNNIHFPSPLKWETTPNESWIRWPPTLPRTTSTAWNWLETTQLVSKVNMLQKVWVFKNKATLKPQKIHKEVTFNCKITGPPKPHPSTKFSRTSSLGSTRTIPSRKLNLWKLTRCRRTREKKRALRMLVDQIWRTIWNLKILLN